MNRNDLLTLARQGGFYHGSALALASRLTTPVAVHDASIHYARRAKLLNIGVKFCLWLFVAGLVFLVGAVVLLLTDSGPGAALAVDPVWCGRAVAAAVAGLFGIAAMGVHTSWHRDCAREHSRLLAPLVGATALESVRGYIGVCGLPEVLAWRDHAFAERGLLHCFDSYVLGDIHYAVRARDCTSMQLFD